MTLDNITTQANNACETVSASLANQKHKPLRISSIGGPYSPHFMAPTVASKRLHYSDSNNRAATPVSTKSIKSDDGKSLIKSAAERVGFPRVGDGTPYAKKERPVKQSRVISFPDKARELYAQEDSAANAYIVVDALIFEES